MSLAAELLKGLGLVVVTSPATTKSVVYWGVYAGIRRTPTSAFLPRDAMHPRY